MKRDMRVYLQDILESILAVEDLPKDLRKKNFLIIVRFKTQ
ncbi:hypothetical protein ES703_68673 [subsurface metagenome]